jgi:hypothetical protein
MVVKKKDKRGRGEGLHFIFSLLNSNVKNIQETGWTVVV